MHSQFEECKKDTEKRGDIHLKIGHSAYLTKMFSAGHKPIGVDVSHRHDGVLQKVIHNVHRVIHIDKPLHRRLFLSYGSFPRFAEGLDDKGDREAGSFYIMQYAGNEYHPVFIGKPGGAERQKKSAEPR